MNSNRQHESSPHAVAGSLPRFPTRHFGKNPGYHRLETFARRFQNFPIPALAYSINYETHGDCPESALTTFRPVDILHQKFQHFLLPAGENGRFLKVINFEDRVFRNHRRGVADNRRVLFFNRFLRKSEQIKAGKNEGEKYSHGWHFKLKMRRFESLAQPPPCKLYRHFVLKFLF